MKYGSKYPNDIKYNACQIGNKVVHNFIFTDNKILEIIEKNDLQKIQVSQGYTNCSIAVIDEKSVIVNDKKIAEILKKEEIDVLCLNKIPGIKLLNEENQYSKMNGFIGGAVAKIENKVVIFGELQKIDENNKIRNFLEKKKLEIIDFKGFDVIDYGGIIVV